MMEFYIFFLGICVGSFLNVCISRFPKDESIVTPGSHCPHCGKKIVWYDNIPLASFILLRGRCRACGKGIAVRYFLVELATGILWVYAWREWGLSAAFGVAILAGSILIGITATDFETGYIPNRFTYFGMICGLAFSMIFPAIHGKAVWHEGLLQSLGGLAGGGGILFLVGWLGSVIFRKDAMGGGDIKLLAMLGAFLGVKKALLIFFVSPFPAIPLALYAKFVKKEETIPFGPFLAIAGLWCLFYGEAFLSHFLILEYW